MRLKRCGSRLFTVNNDIDCLGDMFLELSATLPTYNTVNGGGSNAVGKTNNIAANLILKPFALQSLIERVEFQVGTQVWQTIEKEDLRVVNSTELGADAFAESSIMSTPAITATTGAGSGTAWLVRWVSWFPLEESVCVCVCV